VSWLELREAANGIARLMGWAVTVSIAGRSQAVITSLRNWYNHAIEVDNHMSYTKFANLV
jgi:hypothetical protein